MSPSAHEAPSKLPICLVHFRHGDPDDFTYEYYTNSSSTEGRYSSVSSMEVDLPALTGTLKESSAKLTMPEDAFLQSISEGYAVGPVFCDIFERSRSLEAPISGTGDECLFRGRVFRTTRNYRGRAGSVHVELKNWKSLLDSAANPGSMTVSCNWPFLRGGCLTGLNPNNFTTVGGIDSVSGKVVTCTTPSIIAEADYFWRRGSITVDNVVIDIREWRSSDPTKFYLVREAPASWAGSSATFVAGCDKSLTNCIRHDNEEYFLGPGYATPDYLPITETGRTG
jgi:hypothetical protein